MSAKDFSEKYLRGLVNNHRKKVDERLERSADRLLMYSGALLNWVGEMINDNGLKWRLETVPLEKIIMTGTCPKWNKITLEKAERNPLKLRKLFKEDKSLKDIFKNSKFADIPILIRETEEKEYKVLDGMNRVIAAARDGKDNIKAYIGRRVGKSKAKIEPHVVYDIIRGFQLRGGSKKDFKAAIRLLLDAYSNTEELLRKRFNKSWVADKKIQELISEVLDHP
jgi:hypothetical protein